MPKRYRYSLNHQVATLSDFGRLCPFMKIEVAPGDTVQGVIGALIRLSALKKALLQDVFVDMYVIYVPHRLVYGSFENFIAAGPETAPTYSIPSITVAAASTSYEALWMRSHPTDTTDYNAIPLYAYNLIYNEFFRDESQAAKAPTDSCGQYGALVSFKKDYWTTIQEQYGEAQQDHRFDTNIGTGTQASAKDVLEAIARQKVAMKRATYGTRYIDILRSYGIKVNYQMLQRPEVVAIGRTSINVTDVVQTGVDSSDSGLGELAGHGIGAGRIRIRRKMFPEHGTLMGLCVLRPVWMTSGAGDWFDRPREYEAFWDPGLVTLPPVEITKQDIMPSVASAQRTDSLGWNPWGFWYRGAPSRAHPRLFAIGSQALGFLSQTDFTYGNVQQITASNYDSMFSDTTARHYQASFVNKLKFFRLIPRSNLGALMNA